MKLPVLFLGGILLLCSCKKETVEESAVPEEFVSTEPGELLFKSGFEEEIYISDPTGPIETTNYSDYKFIKGTDATTGYTWPIEILGSNFGGLHYVDDDGSGIESSIELIDAPGGGSTQALFQRVNYSLGSTQSPYQINNITENPNELYIKYWLRTDDTALIGPSKWRAIWEYKTDNYASNDGTGFRMIAFMATNDNGDHYWLFQGDNGPSNPIWQERNSDIPVYMDEWFQVEFHINWSEGNDGYASMKVNGQLVGEHFGPTTINSDDLDFIMLTQIYGNSHPMHQWIDDIEIWDGIPE